MVIVTVWMVQMRKAVVSDISLPTVNLLTGYVKDDCSDGTDENDGMIFERKSDASQVTI